jgi:hypothetical protein
LYARIPRTWFSLPRDRLNAANTPNAQEITPRGLRMQDKN